MDIGGEYEGLRLGDRRLERRVKRVATKVMTSPSESFPKVLKGESEVEGFYRLMSHRSTNMKRLMTPHAKQTVSRAAAYPTVLVAHDTSTFSMPTDRAGLGRVQSEGAQRSFFLHASLAIGMHAQTGTRPVPLGIVAADTHVRHKVPLRKRKGGHHSEKRAAPKSRESARWLQGAKAASACFAQHSDAPIRVVHVADREADQYTLMAKLHTQQERFVIRAKHARADLVCLQDESVGPSLERHITVGERRPASAHSTKHFRAQARKQRQARVRITAARYTLQRPATDAKRRDAPVPEITLHQVCVREIDPPEDTQAVTWTLWTTEPIDTPEQLAWVVDAYRARWLLEEYFKALKTGCSFQQRQLESKDTLFAALAFPDAQAPDAADVSKSRVEATIKIKSVSTGNTKRDRHLTGKDFFNATKFPVMKFVSTSVRKAGGHRLAVKGKLTIRDKTRRVSLLVTELSDPVPHPMMKGVMVRGARATTTINRKDFGMTWNQTLDSGGLMVGDKIKVTLDLELHQQAQMKGAKAVAGKKALGRK